MPLAPETRRHLEELVQSNHVLLFMKGNREQPQCGFSAQVIQILNGLLPSFATIDVLQDPVLRDGVKEFSEWPTIPQLYVDGEFLGGCDIVKEMYASGELHEALKLERRPAEPPELTITPEAAEALRGAQAQSPGGDLHLMIDARFHYSLGFGPQQPTDLRVVSSGVQVFIDPDSASRASGLVLGVKQTERGPQLSIDNPNEPQVRPLSPAALKAAMDAGEPLELIDVRTPAERDRACIEPSVLLDPSERARIEGLPRDTRLVFYCHSGVRSQAAALEFGCLGFETVESLEGGIDAWSREIDPKVPRY